MISNTHSRAAETPAGAAAQPAPFPAGTSAVASLIRAFDWSQTSLGPIAEWPQLVKFLVNTILQSPIPIITLWGTDGVMIYNDGYAIIAANRHPGVLGGKVLEGWPEVAEFNQHVMEVGLHGETLSYHDQHLVLYRSGAPEDVWLDLNYSPILNEHGIPVGVMALVIETTQRVIEERQRIEAEERFQLALEAGAVLGTWVWDIPNDRFTTDARFARFFSLDPAEAERGLSLEVVMAAIHPDDRARIAAQIGRTAAAGGAYRAEYRVRQLDDSYRWIEANGYCNLADDGTPLRFPGLLIDIADRKQAETRQTFLLALGDRLRGLTDARDVMRATSELLGRHFGAGRAGYGEIDPSETFLTVDYEWTDGRMKGMLGRHRLSDFGASVKREFQAGRAVRLDDIASDARTQGASVAAAFEQIDMRAGISVPLHKGGRWVANIYAHTAEPRHWTDEDEQLINEVAERTWDAVERARAEQRLRALNATLEAQVEERTRERDRIWSVSQDLLGIANIDGTWLSVNPAWRHTLGWSEDAIIGRTSEWMEHPDDQPKTRAELSQLAAGQRTLLFENRFRHQDGSYRWFSWTAAASGGLLYCVARDMTTEKARQAELAHMQDQLRQAQKMEAVGQLTGGIAHDFNNLLTGIIGGLDMLQRRIAAGRFDEIDRYVNTATTSAKRAAALTHRLLAFSRRQSLDIAPTDVNRLIISLEDLLRRTLGEGIAFATELQAELWLAQTDANQLENALLNLCINARDAMPNGGQLTVETANTHLDATYAREAGELAPGDYIVMSVSDTGTGMLPNVRERAFDPFFTTKPIGQGTGLGLSMIYGFVKQSGGHIRIYSEVSQGTTIKIYLPRQEATDPSTLEPHGTDRPRAAADECVLLVEDDPGVRTVVVEVLNDLGYQVLEAADANEALPHIEGRQRIDLLITDVGLPGMNGRQLAEIARQKRPDLPILFVTGYAENAAVRGGFLDPGMEMIGKPFDIDALANRIRAMIARQ